MMRSSHRIGDILGIHKTLKPRKKETSTIDEAAEKAFARQKRGRASLVRTSLLGILGLNEDLKRKNLLGD